MSGFSESTVEQVALAWLKSIGWTVRQGAEIAPGQAAAERTDYGQVVLEQLKAWSAADGFLMGGGRWPYRRYRFRGHA